MSHDEETVLWDTPSRERRVLGRKVVTWDTSDGNNDILLEITENAGWNNAQWYAVRYND